MIVLHMSREPQTCRGKRKKKKRGKKEEEKEIEEVDNGVVISGLARLHVHLVSISFEGTGRFYLASTVSRLLHRIRGFLIDHG